MKKDEMDAKLVELMKIASKCSCIQNGEYCSQCVEPIKTALRQSLVKEVEEINKADAGPHDTVYRRDVLKILQEKE